MKEKWNFITRDLVNSTLAKFSIPEKPVPTDVTPQGAHITYVILSRNTKQNKTITLLSEPYDNEKKRQIQKMRYSTNKTPVPPHQM